MNTIKTTLHTYHFNTRNASEAEAYQELKTTLRAQGLKCFESHGSDEGHWRPFADHERAQTAGFGPHVGFQVDLETEHLFDNQWNTAPIPGLSEKGYRVFDWAQDSQYAKDVTKHIKRGHYLEQTAEMRSIRENTNKCGFCGRQEEAQRGLVFCDHCRDSEFLKESDLYLTRMRPVAECRPGKSLPPLSEAERDYLLPLYRQAQIHGSSERGKARIAKQRADVEARYQKAIRTANAEREGFTWLMDRGFNTTLATYYSHTGRFGFGWQRPLSADLVPALLEVISEFPFPYDIKCDDGRTLSGG